jgi:hypothetical protein
MKIIVLLFSLLISVLFSYWLFTPSSSVNLLVSLLIGEKNGTIQIADLAISNLLFLIIYESLTILSQRLNVNQK